MSSIVGSIAQSWAKKLRENLEWDTCENLTNKISQFQEDCRGCLKDFFDKNALDIIRDTVDNLTEAFKGLGWKNTVRVFRFKWI